MILKRTLVFLLTAVLCVGMLTGCAKPGTGTSASAASVSESDTEVSDNKPVTVKNPNYKNVTISEWGYENLEYINEHYLFAKEGDKWIIVSSKSGNKVEYDDTYYINGQEVVIKPFTADEIKELKDFIMSVDRISSYNEEIEKIITEDAEPFFAGQKSAEEVAKVIQSRVNIYINEKQ